MQWHAKHGGVLTVFEFVVWMAFTLLSVVSGGVLGCILLPVQLLIFVAFVIIRIVCIVKATQGNRFELPVLTPLVEKFPSV